MVYKSVRIGDGAGLCQRQFVLVSDQNCSLSVGVFASRGLMGCVVVTIAVSLKRKE